MLIDENIFTIVPHLQSQSGSLALVEFYYVVLDIVFINSTLVGSLGPGYASDQLRIISKTFRTNVENIRLGAQDTEFIRGRDATFDLCNLLLSFCRNSYQTAKSCDSFAADENDIEQADFFDSNIFAYLATLSAAVDATHPQVLYTRLSDDSIDEALVYTLTRLAQVFT